MKGIKYFLIFIILGSWSFCGVIFYSKPADAGMEHAVSGWAWSENIGWISFNNVSGGGGVDYGINIDSATGNLSGNAWSENLGWISFDRGQAGNPPSDPYKTGSGPIAKYDFLTGELTGWMRVLANGGGWDGWIRFCDRNTTHCSAGDQIARVVNGEFFGWAWSDSVVGWISFNCANQEVCGQSDYKALVRMPPMAEDLRVAAPDYCFSGLGAVMNWTFSGGTQSAYQIQISENSDFAVLVSDEKFDSDSTGYSVPLGRLYFNRVYFWRLKVWNTIGEESSWILGPQFSTPAHQYPTVDFSWAPAIPSVNEATQIADQSSVFGGATKTGLLWTIQDGTYLEGTNSASQNPQIKFTSHGEKSVTLKLTDSDGFSCEQTKTIGVRFSLPNWKEIWEN